MKNFSFVTLAMILACLSACSHKKKEKKHDAEWAQAALAPNNITHETVNALIQSWPESSKAAANNIISKYGLPAETTPTLLVWNQTGPFKRTIIHRQETIHNFPTPHTDVIEQVVNYRVPANKVGELWKFDGSISLDRTKGEMAVRNDKEEMNFLSLNLADKIIKGEMKVDKAREEYSRSAQAFSMGNTNQLTNGLNFTLNSETADADRATRTPGRKERLPSSQKQMQEAQSSMENYAN